MCGSVGLLIGKGGGALLLTGCGHMVNTEVVQQSTHRGKVEESAESRCIWKIGRVISCDIKYLVHVFKLTIQTQIVERQDARFRCVALNRDRDLTFVGRHTTNVACATYRVA